VRPEGRLPCRGAGDSLAIRRIEELRERERRLEEVLNDYAAESPGLAESSTKEGLQ
jgi:hypothetical protein